jgi:hypothetical protein
MFVLNNNADCRQIILDKYFCETYYTIVWILENSSFLSYVLSVVCFDCFFLEVY